MIKKAFPLRNQLFHGLNEAQFTQLVKLTLDDTYLKFNDKLYHQIEGLFIGHPIAATLANTFMCHYEEEWLKSCPTEYAPLMYRRYVDDTWVIFKEASHANQFLHYMNGKESEIKFTMEGERDWILPFIGINIHRGNEGFLLRYTESPPLLPSQ